MLMLQLANEGGSDSTVMQHLIIINQHEHPSFFLRTLIADLLHMHNT